MSNNVKKSIVSSVDQLCLLAFTMFFLSTVWASPCDVVTISRFKIGIEFIKVQINESYLPHSQNISRSRKHLLDYTGL